MIKRLDNVKLKIGEGEGKLLEIAKKSLGGLKYFRIIKKSLDARDKSNIFWLYSIEFGNESAPQKPAPEKIKNPPAVAVIGSGPAGLFCALRLIERGFRPIIIERGEAVEERRATIKKFFGEKILNVNSGTVPSASC